MNKILKINEAIFKIAIWICLIILIFLILIVSSNVVSRYVFGNTFGWADEIAIFLLAWVSILAIAIGVEMKLHIAIEFIIEKFPITIQKIIEKLGYILTLVFGVVFAIHGYKLLISGLDATLPATKLPSSTSYLFVPIAGLMIILSSLTYMIFPEHKYDFDAYFLGGNTDGK